MCTLVSFFSLQLEKRKKKMVKLTQGGPRGSGCDVSFPRVKKQSSASSAIIRHSAFARWEACQGLTQCFPGEGNLELQPVSFFKF